MAKVIASITMSIDGYITGPDDGPGADLRSQGSLSHRPTMVNNTTNHPLALPK